MRLIAEFRNEKQVFGFQAFLQASHIPSIYDSAQEPSSQELIYRLWIVEEDDFDKAYAFYRDWVKNPQDPRFAEKQAIPPPPPHASATSKIDRDKNRSPVRLTLNNLILFVCILLFIINGVQEKSALSRGGIIAVEYEATPLEKALFFDYPQFLMNIEKFFEIYPVHTEEEFKALSSEEQACFEKIKNLPTWKGVADLFVSHSWNTYEQIPPGTLFEKIRQGEVWRLFTPVLLHGNIFHILFNMAWVWMLGRSIEQRLGALRYLLFSVIVGTLSNIAQYLMSGPEFLGYSGIVVGMVGFIWMRQKMAPWEGYPLDRTVIRFIAIYVLALLILGTISMMLDYFHVTQMYANIANTAHIVGGVTGIFLARIPFFSRKSR